MKLLHLADIHMKRESAGQVFQSLDVVEREAAGVDLIAIAGDTWDAPMQNSGAAQFPQFLDRIRRLGEIAPVVMIQGTPSHDVDRSLDVFDGMDGVTVLQPGLPYFLNRTPNGMVVEAMPRTGMIEAIIFGVPEPQKKWIMAGMDEKAAAEAAVRDAIRALFLGLGGLRKQYPHIPCVLLYHGPISEATLQNDEKIESGTGIAASIDDLAYVGADYIALGDIHKPQRVGESRGLHAYYPGSLYPCNWGETHDAGFNVVDVAVGFSAFSRISCGHPVNKKIEARAAEFSLDRLAGAKDFRTWLEITCKKDESVTVDTDALLQAMMDAGALPGSRVTLNILPTETVRAGDITSKRALRDKVSIWAENSGRDAPDTILSKADDLEARATAQGLVATGAQIRINKLVLRGAKGLWKKSRIDEATLDLDAMDSGTIALIGANGAGKTTLIENLHPWPCLLTRDSRSLKDHFRLRDSKRELFVTDDLTGIKYRFLITINAATASGTAEYFIYQAAPGQDWQPVAGINGRKDMYVDAVNRIFGSLELYQRTAFVTQRATANNPDLAEATPKARKDIMTALTGVDYLNIYRDMAKKDAETVERQVLELDAKIRATRDSLGNRADIETNIQHLEWTVQAAGNAMDEVSTKATEQTALVAKLQAQKAEQDRMAADVKAAQETHDKAVRDMAAIKSQIADLERSVAGRESAQADISRYDTLKAQEAAENAKETEHLKRNQQQQAEYQNRLRAHADEDRRLRDLLAGAQRIADQARHAVEALENDLARLEDLIAKPVADHCPTCSQLLPADARDHIEAERAQIRQKIELANGYLNDARAKLTNAARDVATDQAAVSDHLATRPEPLDLSAFDSAEKNRIADELAFMDIAGSRRILEAAATAGARIDELGARIIDMQGIIDREGARARDYQSRIDGSIAGRLTVAEFDLSQLRSSYQIERDRQTSAKTSLEHTRDAMAKLEAATKAISTQESELATLRVTATEWRTLEQACGPNGIQALELDAVCPTLAAVANGLLKPMHDGRYQVRFDTTREGGKAQQIEDFMIYIGDNQTGEEQELSTLSGGESVWIKRALYDAFGVIRAQNTGLRFQTVITDEADGALDPAARVAYLRMLESAHRQAGRRHTIVITHSTEVQEMISQRVNVRDLGAVA